MTKLKLPLDTPILDSFAFLFLIVGFIPGLAVGLPIFVLVNQLLTWVVDEPVYLIVAVNIILELMAGYGVQKNRGSIATVELYFAYAFLFGLIFGICISSDSCLLVLGSNGSVSYLLVLFFSTAAYLGIAYWSVGVLIKSIFSFQATLVSQLRRELTQNEKVTSVDTEGMEQVPLISVDSTL